jgi:hypothetical protein
MRFKLFLQFCCFCAVIFVAFSNSVFAQTDKIDIPQLLKEARQKTDENWRTMLENYPNYTYKWRRVWRAADKKGKVEEKSDAFEIFMPLKCGDKKCRTVSILFEENGKLVSAEKLEKERIKAGEKLEKLENDKDAQGYPRKLDYPSDWMRFAHFKRRPFSDETEIIVKMDGQEILEKCEFFSPEREQINGREAISLKFRPRADAVFSAKTNYLLNAEGKIWIDAGDKVIFRLLIWQKGTKFENETSDYLLEQAAAVYDMTRTREAVWYFRFAEFRGLKNSSLFGAMKDDFSIEHFDYHFFKTEIKEVELNKPSEK